MSKRTFDAARKKLDAGAAVSTGGRKARAPKPRELEHEQRVDGLLAKIFGRPASDKSGSA